MANVKIPYPLIPAVSLDTRRAQMESAIARGLPRLTATPIDPARTLHIACFGPSLAQTCEHLRGKSPIIAMSGATKFLAARGIIADYALEMDPRVSQLTVSLPPVPGVTYLIASCVVPAYFDAVLAAGNRVVLWHTVSSNFDDETEWVSKHDPGQFVVSTGSTVGLGAIQVGGLLGFSRFEIHGMDGSFSEDGNRHAGTHGGKAQPPDIQWAALGKTYRTSKIMANAVAETINTAKNFPIITIWHGDGLTQALIRKAKLTNAACADETAKVEQLRGLQPVIVKAPPTKSGQSFWEALMSWLAPTDLPELVANIGLCEPRRAVAEYNTGTVPFESAVYLRALARFYEATRIVEVGTFIGTSAMALAGPGRAVFTCDASNDCVPADTKGVVTHPHTTSTAMLRTLDGKVDLFFFDGRIQPEDVAEITRLSHAQTVYVVDDYVGAEKGVANMQILTGVFRGHVLIPPGKGPSTLAVLAPMASAVRS
jgi:hypothetical protein